MSMEKSEVTYERVGMLADGLLLSSNSFKGTNGFGDNSAFYEKFLLDDLDSYWDDLSARLTVSRMVSDSVVKGIVNAVVGEAADKIALKDAEIEILNERLRYCKSEAAKGNKLESSMMMMSKLLVTGVETQKMRSQLWQSHVDVGAGSNYSEHLGMLKIAVEEQLETVRTTETFMERDERVDGLKATLEVVFEQINSMFFFMKASACELQWEHEIQREVATIVAQKSIRGLHDEFETKLYEQRRLNNALSMNWQKKVDELSNMREELHAISWLFSSETGSLLSYNSIESFEERNAGKGKDHFSRKIVCTSHPEENGTTLMDKSMDSPKPMLEVADSPQLKHMTKEEVITYYKTEMLKMSRQHDQALQEKTEELFRLKREFLKEKGSSYLRKDKDLEIFRKKILEVILKLDDILLEKEKLPMVHDAQDELCNLKDRFNTLLFENQRLQGLLTDKGKEVKSLSSQVSDAAGQMLLHSSVEANFLKRIKKLKGDVEDLKIEAKIRNDVYNSILTELTGEHECGMDDMQIQSQIVQEIYSIFLRGVAQDAISKINPLTSKYYTEKASLEALLSEKERMFCLEMEENKKLKQDVMSLSTLMKEKEKFVSEAGFTLVQQQENFDKVKQELSVLRYQVNKQEILIADKDTELSSMKSRLDQTLQQIHQYKLEINEFNHKCKIASDALEEAEKQKTILHDIIEEKQKAFSSSITKDEEQAKQMKCIITSVMELSRAIADLENRLSDNIQRNESRLQVLSHQCVPLTQHASLQWKKGLWYRQILEIKSSNLEKAEAEVDLLGDEVDALLSLLGKIYIALDHYSPIFELYPGVMEILKLVQRELKGETIRLVVSSRTCISSSVLL